MGVGAGGVEARSDLDVMRVAILTSGRFHVCDLARELDRLGHDVAFYSLVPSWRTRRFGLPTRCSRWLGPLVAPLLGADILARNQSVRAATTRALSVALDHVAARVITRCDVFIGMSSLSLHTLQVVRRKFGARVFLERGSRHIVSQREILDTIPGARITRSAVPQWAVDRELAEYDLTDKIVVPANHAVSSFVEKGVLREKLFRNPYGVDLSMFPATASPAPGTPPRILMVGAWSLQKGCDLLVEAWRRLPGTELIHVGALAGAPVPNDPGFLHIDPVDQRKLSELYASAHVFALASRQEGLALVQAQALASGLPIVCSDRTGGEDLRECVRDPNVVSVVPVGDVDALAKSLRVALDAALGHQGIRNHLGAAREKLSWAEYGRRYDAALRE